MHLKHLAYLLPALLLMLGGCRATLLQEQTNTLGSGSITPTGTVALSPAPTTASSTLGKVAFVQAGDIWVQDLPDGPPQRLTHDGQNDSPRWSPSGEWLSFVKSNHLWIIRASGTDAHAVEAGATMPVAWSPVADRIAYHRSPENGISSVNADGTQRRTLVAPATPTASTVKLAWSPDGTWLAYEYLDRPAITPTVGGLFRVAADGGDPQPVYLNPNPLKTQSYLAGWMPDGQRLLYWQGAGMSASIMADGLPLLSVPVHGGTPVTLTQHMLAYPEYIAWSPTGTLALIDGGGRSTWSNKRLAVRASGLRYLTGGDVAALSPAWSPDGRWIAFSGAPATQTDGGTVAQHASFQRRIWLVASDGSITRQLTTTADVDDEHPRWSNDGSVLLFARLQAETASLWIVHSDGSGVRRVVATLSPAPTWFSYCQLPPATAGGLSLARRYGRDAPSPRRAAG